MALPKITVITVCYNCQASIERTLLSVINQTYKNIEYIIIDGLSTDGTVNIVYKYINNITVFITEPDKGIYDAMNKGIKLATGEWIIFMNSGDSFHDTNVLNNVFIDYHDNGESIIYGKVAEIDNQNNYTGIERYGYESCFPACHQAIFTRKIELQRDYFHIDYKIIADYNFYYHLYKRNPYYYKSSLIIADYNNDGYSRKSYELQTKEYIKLYYRNLDTRLFKYVLRYLKNKFLNRF